MWSNESYVGMYNGSKIDGRVYIIEGICPALVCGHANQPKIIYKDDEDTATDKDGVHRCE